MFPGAGARIYSNEAGEPIGWDYPNATDYWCDFCGFTHSGPCPDGEGEDLIADPHFDDDEEGDGD